MQIMSTQECENRTLLRYLYGAGAPFSPRAIAVYEFKSCSCCEAYQKQTFPYGSLIYTKLSKGRVEDITTQFSQRKHVAASQTYCAEHGDTYLRLVKLRVNILQRSLGYCHVPCYSIATVYYKTQLGFGNDPLVVELEIILEATSTNRIISFLKSSLKFLFVK